MSRFKFFIVFNFPQSRNKEETFNKFGVVKEAKSIDFRFMFRNCFSLEELDVSKFVTKNAVTMKDIFRGCESLTSLDLTNFDTS